MDYYNRTDLNYYKIVKESVLYPVVKIELLDDDENSYAEITQMISQENQGAITSTYQSGIRNSVSFSIFDPSSIFLPDPNYKNFWIDKKLKVYLGLSNNFYEDSNNPLLYGNNTNKIIATDLPLQKSQETLLKYSSISKDLHQENYWFSKGVYIITDIEIQQNGASRMVHIQGVDKFGAFTNDTGYGEMIGTFSLKKGTNISTAIKEILRQDRGNGKFLDPITPIIDPYYQDFVLPLDIDKGPGAYVGDLLIDLSNSLHADAYYDMNGRFNLWRSMDQDEYKQVQRQWYYTKGDQEYLNNTLNYSLKQVANMICVVGDNPSAKILPQATVENRNPRSPLNIEKIGRKSRYIESSNIQSYREAKEYANYILKTNTLLGHTLNFNSTLIPHLEVDNLINITDEDLKLFQEDFLIVSLTMPIGLGEMQVSVSNIKELPEE